MSRLYVLTGMLFPEGCYMSEEVEWPFGRETLPLQHVKDSHPLFLMNRYTI